MKKLAVIGGGDLGKLIAHHAQQNLEFELVGFYDDYLPVGKAIEKLGKTLGGLDKIQKDYAQGLISCLALGIGYKHFSVRKKIFDELSCTVPFANIIHQSSYVDPSCTLGQGVIISPGCILDRKVSLADNIMMNPGCILAHDVSIGSHCFLAPGVKIAGFSKVGNSCFLGIGTTLIDRIEINDQVQTGGATTVTQNITESGLYVGTPARKIR